jgi:aldehyde dehydrogenase (NAD+)
MPAWQFSGPQLEIVQGWLRYYAGMADKLEGLVTAAWPAESLEYTLPEPLGVIAAIIPWNAPLISLAMKVPAALAAGNCVIVKPAEFTPFTPAQFAQLALEAGLPEKACCRCCRAGPRPARRWCAMPTWPRSRSRAARRPRGA